MFCNPVFRAERYSYPVPTPGAMDHLLRSVYWKPQMRYVIKRICVANEPKYGCEVLRHVVAKFPQGKPEAQMRSENYLMDVHYGVEFDIELTGINAFENNTVKKHEAILRQRLSKGQYYKPPYLGTKECTCEVTLADGFPEKRCNDMPLGCMLHHVEHDAEGNPTSFWYWPVMKDGIIDATVIRKPEKFEEGDFLKNLVNLYDMHGADMGMPPLGFELARITYEAVLTPKGILKAIRPLQTSENNKPYPKLLCVPKAAVKTFNVAANFLWGNAEYLFSNEEKRNAFVAKMKEVAGEKPPKAMDPVLQFYKKFDDKHVREELDKAGVEKENLVFRIAGADQYVLDDEEVKDCWSRWTERERAGNKTFCVITGKKEVPAKTHPSVRGVWGAGPLARLLSMDEGTPSLNAYKYKGYQNAPISEITSQKIHLALNGLLQRGQNKYDTENGTVVFWARNSLALAESLAAVTGNANAKFNGAIPDGEPFYLLELRGNGTGRIYVRQYARLEYGKDSKKKLEQFLISSGCTKMRFDLLSQWEGGSAKSVMEERGYLLGCLFAVMEQAAIDALNEPFYGPTSFYAQNFRKAQARPAAAFARLHGKARIYLQKADFGLGREYVAMIKKLDKFIMPYPDSLEARDRNLFVAGYESEKANLVEARQQRLEKIKNNG